MKALIVDDEKAAREVLEYLLRKEAPGWHILPSCATADEAISAIHRGHPEVVFLDIEMPWKSGFDMLQELGSVAFHLVFTTAYDKYAVRAFRYSAADYLLKPINAAELRDTVMRITRQESAKGISAEHLQFLLGQLHSREGAPQRLALYTTEGVRFINPEKVMRCESKSNYTYFFFEGGEKVVSSRTLKDVESIFAPYNFYRTHQSHLINLRHVDRYSKEDGGYIIMSDGAQVDLARARKEEFLELFSRI
jgi:two-component system, LytTR family, response regulator